MGALVVFSVDVRRLATFYESVLGAEPTYEASGDIRIVSDRDEVLIHWIPAEIAKTIEVRVPPVARDTSPIKPVLDVDSVAIALDRVRAHGGVVTSHAFDVDGVARHDVLDPDGNVVQRRRRMV
jgi:Glyoxalase-like domain